MGVGESRVCLVMQEGALKRMEDTEQEMTHLLRMPFRLGKKKMKTRQREWMLVKEPWM